MVWKAATFNVNGIRARLPLLLEWLQEQRPHVACLQEIKCQDKDFPHDAFVEAGYHVVWKGQKSFNGVAVLTTDPPQEVVRETDREVLDGEARFLAVKTCGVWVINTYVPQGRSPQDPAFGYKLAFLKETAQWIDARFAPDVPLLWTGDINVAPDPQDVYDPQRLDGEVGFHPEERRLFKEILGWGLVDLFRHLHPDEKQFTFWDYRLPRSVQRNLGWRLDHMLVTEPLAQAARDCRVDMTPRQKPKPSDHTPLVAVFHLDALSVSSPG
ncbi:Exodeoxyribonuclease III [Desulfacinum hydrothermale DSM 13146]|uniref:Exodeoxyribonuclease III n=1 Tax=Desulfacinum hydrothermale DSM 13146 TaxID=1121390 RepID=A0A1W1XAQ5_9BACT|nr:exodeoxyribonuclease III [Desulfacinum hydrothermale]SMC21016.1 Exodeoxyribonuclease III [Desulfacinum hydrothermale DSM 13146]